MIFKSKAKNGSVSESPGRSGLEDIPGMGGDEFGFMSREKAKRGPGEPERKFFPAETERPKNEEPLENSGDAVPRPQARPIFESEGKNAAPAAAKFEDLFAVLEKYRKSEIADDNRKIGYFQNGGRIILDGESLIREMIQILENAKKLAREGFQAESSKDLFFLRQKMISSQEVLRTIVFRSFKMCEKERCVLPGYAAHVLNFGVLKDLLDKLTLENWSNPEDFNRFEDYAGKLRDAFYRKITPPLEYVKSILAELKD